MSWFNGQLEITFTSGDVVSFRDVTLDEANRIVENYNRADIRWAIYSPSPCSL